MHGPAHIVVIENQFGRTDHRHLGQILTYLAGVERAKTVVWIAETIQADHRGRQLHALAGRQRKAP
jgi:hypothetical protein